MPRSAIYLLAAALAAVAFFLVCAGFPLPVEFVVLLIGGWVMFLWRVMRQIHLGIAQTVFAARW